MTDTSAADTPRRRPVLKVLAGGAPAGPAAESRAVVIVERGHIDVVADGAGAAVFAPGSPYYLRGDVLVRAVLQAIESIRNSRPEAPTLVVATPPGLLDDLERSCVFVSRSESADGEVRTRIVGCPKALPSVMIARAGRLPVPTIRAISEIPLLHADGTLIKEGYDSRAGVLVIAPGPWPAIPEVPTESDARAALARIDALISGFPFVSAVDRAVTIAAYLSAALRPTLPTCPAFAWSAPVRGSGKSKAADVAAIIPTGRTAPALSWPPQEEEAEKRLGASVMAGQAVLLLDNIETPLHGTCLNSLLTQPTVSIRVLGRSQMVTLGAAVLVLATGNNLVVRGDLSRRFLVAQLDPATERPELRTFDFDPVARALLERRELVAALHTIARWGHGRPTGLAPLGSFEEWSRRVRDPLVALGLPDCCSVLEALHQADPEREAAMEVMAEWQRCFGRVPTTVAHAIRRAIGGDQALRDALDGVAGVPGGINAKRLGRYLLRNKDRVFGEITLRQCRDASNNTASWMVDSATSPRVTRVIRVSVDTNVEHSESDVRAETDPGYPGNPPLLSSRPYDDVPF
jgi:putative DNA primase/helicase